MKFIAQIESPPKTYQPQIAISSDLIISGFSFVVFAIVAALLARAINQNDAKITEIQIKDREKDRAIQELNEKHIKLDSDCLKRDDFLRFEAKIEYLSRRIDEFMQKGGKNG